MRVLVSLMLLWTIGIHAAEAELPLRVQSAMNTRHLPYESLCVYVVDV